MSAIGKVRRDHPRTAHAAAVAIAPRMGTQRRSVLDYIASRGERGATDEQMQKRLRMNPSSQRPRRVELVEARLIKDSGRTRRTESQQRAIVWVLTKRGRKALNSA